MTRGGTFRKEIVKKEGWYWIAFRTTGIVRCGEMTRKKRDHSKLCCQSKGWYWRIRGILQCGEITKIRREISTSEGGGEGGWE